MYLEDLTKKIRSINDQKQVALLNALAKKGIIIDLEEEGKRKFKRLMCESHTTIGIETYYFNDGSINGLKIISFVEEEPEYKITDTDHKYTISYKSILH